MRAPLQRGKSGGAQLAAGFRDRMAPRHPAARWDPGGPGLSIAAWPYPPKMGIVALAAERLLFLNTATILEFAPTLAWSRRSQPRDPPHQILPLRRTKAGVGAGIQVRAPGGC